MVKRLNAQIYRASFALGTLSAHYEQEKVSRFMKMEPFFWGLMQLHDKKEDAP